MRRVGIFLNQCLPLSEIFVKHQADALSRYDHHYLACRRVSPSIPIDASQITALNTGGLPGKLVEAAFKATGFAPAFDGAARSCALLHAHFGPTGFLALPVARRAGIPLVITLHGFDVLKRTLDKKADGALQLRYARHRSQLADTAARFICVSEYTKSRAIEFGFPADKCLVHYMGIPLAAHTMARAPRDPAEPLRLIAVGRLVPFKGHARLIDAVAKLEQAGHRAHVDIVGGGPLREHLERQASENLSSYRFHGALPHIDVTRLMRQSDIFCHTSLHQENGQTEAFGLVLLEAQWAGLPVVAFASGGVPEAMADGVTGHLIPEGDSDAFAAALAGLIADPARLAHYAAAAPEFVAAHFDNRVQTAKLETVYDAVCDR